MVLVSGAAGYVGSVLVRRLLAAGYAVRALDRMFFGARGLDEVRDKVDVRVKDVRLADETDLEGVSAVVHLAAFSNDPTADFWPALTRRINAIGTRHLATLCAEHGIARFVLASTASLYDTGSAEAPGTLDESAPVAPTAIYALSKLQAEQEVLAVRARYPEFCPVILRKGTVYGLSPRPRHDLVVNTMVVRALRDGVISVHGDGSIWRPMVSVDDAAEAYLLALRAPAEDVAGRVFNIVEDNYQVREIAATVWLATGYAARSVMVQYTEPKGKLRNYRVDGMLARTVLGFAPAVTVEQAAREMVWHFADHPEGLDGAAALRSKNIDWLTHLQEVEEELGTMRGVL